MSCAGLRVRDRPLGRMGHTVFEHWANRYKRCLLSKPLSHASGAPSGPADFDGQSCLGGLERGLGPEILWAPMHGKEPRAKGSAIRV